MSDATDGQLRAYLDDELEPAVRDALAQRLEDDPALAERLDEIRALGAEVDALFGDEPPPLATPAKPPRIEGDPREERANATPWLPLAGVAAAVALLAAAVLLWLRPSTSGDRGRLAPSDARETVAVGDRATIVAEPGATVAWDIAENGDAAVRQEVGTVFYRVEDGGTFSVATPGGSVTVTGTCFTVDVIPMKEWMKRHGASGAGGMALGAALMLTVHEGSVVLANDEGTLAVNAGDHAVAVEGRAPYADDGAELPVTAAAPAEDRLAELRQRDRAQRKRIAELEQRLETARPGKPEPPTSREAIRRCASSAGSPNCSNVDPEPAVLEEMARCGTIKIDRPPFLQKRTPTGYAPPPELTALVDLSDDEIALMTEVNTKFANDFSTDLQQIVADLNDGTAAPVPPGAPAWAIIPSFISAMDASAPDDAAADLRRKIAQERAGLATPPAEDADLEPFERYERMRADVGENYEKALAEVLGADRAHELRVANDGWGSNMLFGGACPDDDE
ncbi:MAG: hypothetical protein AAF721_11760 [Myxococcota bacterium]